MAHVGSTDLKLKVEAEMDVPIKEEVVGDEIMDVTIKKEDEKDKSFYEYENFAKLEEAAFSFKPDQPGRYKYQNLLYRYKSAA